MYKHKVEEGLEKFVENLQGSTTVEETTIRLNRRALNAVHKSIEIHLGNYETYKDTFISSVEKLVKSPGIEDDNGDWRLPFPVILFSSIRPSENDTPLYRRARLDPHEGATLRNLTRTLRPYIQQIIQKPSWR